MAKAPPDKKLPPPLPPSRGKPAAKPTTNPAAKAAPAPMKTAAKGAIKPTPSKGDGKSARSASTAPAAPAGRAQKPAPAFPKKNQPPTAGAFAARLPLPLGKRFDAVRSQLLKAGAREDVYFYGPETGWALRYMLADRPLCSLHIYDEQPVGIVALGPRANAGIDWRALSPVGQKARKQAHGSPTLLWLDVPLEGDGAGDFKAILRAKLAAHDEDGPASNPESTDVTYMRAQRDDDN
jgi:hypothetical protein